MLNAVRNFLFGPRKLLSLAADKPEIEKRLANDYKVSFARNYIHLENYDARLSQYGGLLSQAHRNASRVISVQDEMMHSKFNTVDVYMTVGRSALQLMISALIENDLDAPKTILDMPCGYGREARYLRAAFPDAKIYGCDLNLAGVEFCQAAFDMLPIESKVNFTDIVFPASFDAIWCGSLLTHLSSERAKQLLDLFCDSLNPNGILLFSSHGRIHADFIHDRCFTLHEADTFAQIKRDYQTLGYGYAGYPGSPDYGLALTSPNWIYDYVAGRSDITLRSYAERAWHGLHDVSVIQKVKVDEHLYP